MGQWYVTITKYFICYTFFLKRFNGRAHKFIYCVIQGPTGPKGDKGAPGEKGDTPFIDVEKVNSFLFAHASVNQILLVSDKHKRSLTFFNSLKEIKGTGEKEVLPVNRGSQA